MQCNHMSILAKVVRKILFAMFKLICKGYLEFQKYKGFVYKRFISKINLLSYDKHLILRLV